MPDLWDSGPALPAPTGLQRDAPVQAHETPAQAPRLDPNAATVSPEIAGPAAFGLARAYGSAWQQDYGTIAGRTLTGATPAEAFPDAATPERQQARDALATILTPGQRGADHPDVAGVLQGALADGMAQPDRATVNQAALAAAVARDPEALIDTRDIPREHLAAWRDLAMRPLGPEATSQITAMNGRTRQEFAQSGRSGWVGASDLWSAQPVSEAIGGTVNMDYYAVRVDRMPHGVTPEALLREIRIRDFAGMVNPAESTFHPYGKQEIDRGLDVRDRTGMSGREVVANERAWRSADPTGAFVHIDIPGDRPAVDNDGTVAVIDADRRGWTFATVHSLLDDFHPVSGNREFGYSENRDGSVTFYTRGVDRIQERWMDSVNAASRVVPQFARHGGIVFEGGDRLWRSFQARLEADIERRGGQATIERPVVAQPDWNRVEAVLEGRERVRDFYARDR